MCTLMARNSKGAGGQLWEIAPGLLFFLFLKPRFLTREMGERGQRRIASAGRKVWKQGKRTMEEFRADGDLPTELRRTQILAYIKTRDFVRVTDLSNRFHVSEVTVRADLDVLAE